MAILSCLLVVGLPHTMSVAQTPEIGVTAAVRPAAMGTRLEDETRTLQVGTNVFANERVVTTTGGQAQMLFLDESALTIGPNSDVVLDEFVYDPEAESGTLILNATKGVFRLVGGKISKKSAVILKTPTATIGIRGGIALVNIADSGTVQATFVFGESLVMESGGVTKKVTRAGYFVEQAAPGATPSDPAPASAAMLEGALTQLEAGVAPRTIGAEDGSGAGEGAGAEEADAPQPLVTDAEVAGSGLSAVGSENEPQGIDQTRVSRVGQRFTRTDATRAAGDTTRDAVESQQDAAIGDVAGTPPLGGRYVSDFPYLLNTQVGSLRFSADPARFITYQDGVFQAGRFVADLDGSSFVVPVREGVFTFGPSDTQSPFGPVSGAGFVAADRSFVFFELTEVLNGNNGAFLFGGVPAGVDPTAAGFGLLAIDLRRDAIVDSNVPFLRQDGGGALANFTISPLLLARRPLDTAGSQTVFIQSSLGVIGQGPNQRSVLSLAAGRLLADAGGRAALAGKVRGFRRQGGVGKPIVTVTNVSSVAQTGGESLFGDQRLAHFVLGSDLIDNDTGQRSTALGLEATLADTPDQAFFTFNHVGTVTATLNAAPNDRTSITLNGYAGGLVEPLLPGDIFPTPDIIRVRNNNPTNLTITSGADTNRLTAEFKLRDASARNYTLRFGTSLGETGRSAFIDDGNFGAIESKLASRANGVDVARQAMLLVSEGLVPAADVLPSGVSFCKCSFLKWGYWAADLDYGAAHPDANRRDRIHLATWVAGKLPKLLEIPTGGEVTYTGHINGSVNNNGALYQAVGTFVNTWNFAAESGAITITNFDGVNYTGSASAANRRDFVGAIAAPNRTGVVAGSFFKGGGDPVVEQGGQFRITESTGTPYRAAGTFAASK